MQAMPSVMPLSRTASTTSSVMSRTASPPAVRSSVSRWKTFTAPSALLGSYVPQPGPIVRDRAAYVTGEPSVAVAAAGGRPTRGARRRPAPFAPADLDRPGHALGPVPVDRAVHLVGLAGGECVLDGLVGAGLDVPAFDLLAASAGLDREGVRDGAVVRDLERVGAGLLQRDGGRSEAVLLLGDLDRPDDRSTAGAARAAAAVAAAARCEQQSGGGEEEQPAHLKVLRR